MNLQSSLLRSISLSEDLNAPARLAHFRPTRKGMPILRAVMGAGAATLVVAPYGSGKSLAAGVAALGVKNDATAQEIIAPMLPRIAAIDPALEASMAERLQSGRRGIIIPLSGHVPDLEMTLAASLKLRNPPGSLEGILEKVGQTAAWDHLAIVWDEFGRHLEGLVADGRARDLADLQKLAEWAARASAPSASLSLLLHQDLLAYATRLNQTAQSEWRKVEGRFAQVRYLEDSREVFALIADLVSEVRSSLPGPQACRAIDAAAAVLSHSGWFDGLSDEHAIQELLRRAYPLSAGALQALPGIAARVGQSERGMFAFLNEANLAAPIGTDVLFERFSDAMRSDIGVGGTFQRWLATENARGKAQSAAEREALSAACLLRFGRDGETRRLKRDELSVAVATAGVDDPDAAISSLTERKLVWWSKRDDDVSVWRGSDVDLGQHVREQRGRLADSLDLQRFLDERAYAPAVRPHRHNAQLNVNRHLRPSLATAAAFLRAPKGDVTSHPTPTVTYVVPSTDAERQACLKAVLSGMGERPYVVTVIPNAPLDLGDAALEVLAIEALQSDQAVLASGPGVGQELAELLALANVHFGTAISSLVDPKGHSAAWFHGNIQLAVSSERPAQAAASALFDKWYTMTPVIANDQLVRDRISRQMRTTRVRVSRRILENASLPNLGLDLSERSAELSVYRTVLKNTGLHVTCDDGTARLAQPSELKDLGLREAWKLLEAFFAEPAEEPKPFTDLVDRLRAPPFGISSGVIPLLAAAAYSAFARAVAVVGPSGYQADMLGFDVDRIFEDPAPFTIRVFAQDPCTLAYLGSLSEALGGRSATATDERIRLAHDALLGFRKSLPFDARRGLDVTGCQRAVLEALTSRQDAATLFLDALPHLSGGRDEALEVLKDIRLASERLTVNNLDRAARIVAEVLAFEGNAVIPMLERWVSCIDVPALLARDDVRITDKAFVKLAASAGGGGDSAAALGGISSILIRCDLDAWDQGSAARFRVSLREARSRIEEAVLDGPATAARMRPILEHRLQVLQAALLRIDQTGSTRAAEGRPPDERRVEGSNIES